MDDILVCSSREEVLKAIKNKHKFKINSITYLNLMGDNIGSEGVKYLSDSLKSNTTINSTVLLLSHLVWGITSFTQVNRSVK